MNDPSAEEVCPQQSDFPQSPLYRATHSDRYARQEVIRSIEELTGRELLVYEANLFSERSSLGEEDVQPFADLLCRVERDSGIDLVLQSPGGSIDAAEKVVYMCRELASRFRVIVPEYAKSAATLIALASDEVIMGITSELGPIDAQLSGPGPGGARFQTSAQCFIDEFE
ncbi:MAG: ATP-dependent Clp protease proteolytic subunit, partial [Candidatus Brocadiia bacterium]